MKVRSAQGLAQIAADAFETVLFNLVRPWLIHDNTPVVVSGLAGVQQATPVPVVPCPCHPAKIAVIPLDGADDRLTLYALPGLRPAGGDRAVIAHDSLIRGVAAVLPEFTGSVCIPDRVTQWVELEAGQVVGARAFMTADLTNLLAPQDDRLLPVPGPSLDPAAFSSALREALERPDQITQQIIPARSDDDPLNTRLKGVLIGTELAGTQDLWRTRPVMVVNASPWSDLYDQALTSLGADVRPCDRDGMTLTGLTHAFRLLARTFA